MSMKRKQTRTPLKVEFKQFQRLPDWSIIMRSMDSKRPLEDASVPKVDMAALLAQENRFGIRSLAE
jgi:hypothetical protein